jgi:hypothetical protein
MATYTKCSLSGCTNGKGFLVSGSATGASGSVIHMAVSGTDSWDEVWIYAVNTSVNATKLTLEWGETVIPNGNIEVTIPGEGGLYLVSPGLLLQNGLNISAFASTGSVIVLHGFVNRIS